MTKYYHDSNGKYVGGFDGALPPQGSIEVMVPPVDARMLWNGTTWIADPTLEDKIIEEDKLEAIQVAKITLEDRVEALWERVVKGTATATDALEIKLDEIDSDFDKP